MKKYAFKNEDGTIGIVHSKYNPSGILPEGAVLLNEITEENPQPDFAIEAWADNEDGDVTVDLAKARECKMNEIRKVRDAMLLNHDKQWIIAMKDSADMTDLDADRAVLKDLPANSQTALDALADLEDIKNYDAFNNLNLIGSYE